MIKKCAAQGFYCINSFSSTFFGPNSKRAPIRSVQLEDLYLEALLYTLLVMYQCAPKLRTC